MFEVFSAFHLEKNSSVPLYHQLVEYITAAFRRGDLVAGTKLPPIRKLAETLEISPITVTQAYDLLAAKGITAGQVGRGTYILAPRDLAAEASPALLQSQELDLNSLSTIFPTETAQVMTVPASATGWIGALQRYVRPNRAGEIQRLFQRATRQWEERGNLLNVLNANPDPNLFAISRWRQSMVQAGQALEQDAAQPSGNAILQYGSALGDAPLRTFLASYFKAFGFQPNPDDIMLTSGSQQALDLVARVFTGPGDPVFVEEWTYVAALDIFDQRGVDWRPAPVDNEGMRLDVLEQMLGGAQERPRLLYTIPTAQSPTGRSLSVERRQKLAGLARIYNLLIVEDDHCNEIFYEGKAPAPTIRSFDSEGRVIYLKSFSKTIFPALRIGCIVAAQPILARLFEGKQVFDRVTSIPLARAVLQHIHSPAYERELRAFCEEYRQRRDFFLARLEEELASLGCRWTIPQAGFSLLLTLPPGLEEREVVERAVARGLLLLPGQLFSPGVGRKQESTIRLTFADKSPEQLLEVVARLSSTLRSFLYPDQSQQYRLDLLAPV